MYCGWHVLSFTCYFLIAGDVPVIKENTDPGIFERKKKKKKSSETERERFLVFL